MLDIGIITLLSVFFKEKNMSEEGSSSLEDNRIIYVSGEFNEDMTKNVFEKLISLEKKSPNKDILLIIDSYGGYCHSFLAIHDAIRMSRCDVSTFCIGKAMSCGQMTLMSGTKGKRFASPNARILVHELSAEVWGKLTDMEIDINEHKTVQKIMEGMFEEYTGLTKAKVKKLMQRDSFLSAEEAKEMGIIDDIIKCNKDLYKRIKL
jgi:ATP-dependent Clp protease protease subunit